MLDDFLFGAATSAYQIEGAWHDDGKVPSIWDELSHKKGYVMDEHTGDIASDHYHLFRDDVAMMHNFGLQAYRFSISWSRVINEKGKINQKGIEFYQKLVNALLYHNIVPFATLYHWDLPKWLNEQGGWDNPKTVDEFICYARLMFEKLPEVKNWITFNEPAVFIPNYWGLTDKTKATKNMFLAHGTTVQLLKDMDKKKKIGITFNLFPYLGKTETEEEKNLKIVNELNANWCWLDPVMRGDFPLLWRETYKLTEDEKQIIENPGEFIGINYYSAAGATNRQRDDMGIGIVPEGIYEIMKRIKERYKTNIPMYIFENGCAFPDVVLHDGAVHDNRRIQYIREHLYFVNKAIKEGINCKGYFYWSLMDNFEWTFGYTKRFGLTYINYHTLERIPKDSFYWYKKIIENKKFRKEELHENRICNSK